MNINKFTQKSMQAVQDCEKLAYEYGNQEIDQEHLLYALLTQEDSLIAKLITKMEIQLEYFTERAQQALEKKTKVSGGNLYISNALNKVLISAEDEAKAMGDQYVSVEHLFLSMIREPNQAIKAILKEFGITRERFLKVLSTVRGNQQVVTDNPEATYDTLNKNGEDLVDIAYTKGNKYHMKEYLLLSMIRKPNQAIKAILKEFGITRERFLKVLSTVRGNQQVVTDNPEATYDTLNKYGQDLVEKAREQKL